MRKILLSGIVLLVLLASFASAATINAASCSYNDVTTAINSASDGDTVRVPACSATWSQRLIITKYINLMGAGIGSTVITSAFAADAPFTPKNCLVSFIPTDPSKDLGFRLSGFDFDLAGLCIGICLANPTNNPVHNVRVDHNRIINSLGRAMGVTGNVWGVADHNNVQGMVTTYGLNSNWNSLTFSFGTVNNFYYEDNIITNDNTFQDSGVGGRWCSRYNQYFYTTTTRNQAPGFDWHGNQAGANHAIMGVEIYGNTMNTGIRAGGSFGARGGKALVYNNVIKNTYDASQYAPKLREEYDDSLNPPATSPDGQPQHVSDTYFWNNLANGVRKNASITGQVIDYGGSVGIVPREDSTFFNQKEPFTGASGMGVGLKSARPAKCTLEGAAYWATDESKLYRWHNGAWELFYIPYIYPHPLTVAPFGTKICGEGVISSSCWCQGLKSTGYCCHGYYQTASCSSSVVPPVVPPPACTASDWSYTDGSCQSTNTLVRTWTKIGSCQGGVSHSATETISCTYSVVLGDINSDGRVDISDLSIVALNFGKSSGFDARVNVVKSTPEIIDIADLSFVAKRFTG